MTHFSERRAGVSDRLSVSTPCERSASGLVEQDPAAPLVESRVGRCGGPEGRKPAASRIQRATQHARVQPASSERAVAGVGAGRHRRLEVDGSGQRIEVAVAAQRHGSEVEIFSPVDVELIALSNGNPIQSQFFEVGFP